MAITYVETPSWYTGGTEVTNVGAYKEITFVGCQIGDLLCVGGGNEGYNSIDSGPRYVSTLAGSTSAWTQTDTSPVSGQDVDSHAGWATVSAAGDVTVRLLVRCSGTSRLGVAGFRIPAGEWSGTPMFTTSGGWDSNGLIDSGITLTATSTVLYWGFDWTAQDLGVTADEPLGGTLHHAAFDNTSWSQLVGSWTGQAVGTRDYGPAGLDNSHDMAIIVLAIDEEEPVVETSTFDVVLRNPTGAFNVVLSTTLIEDSFVVWNGSEYVQPKFWNGSAWVFGKVWNGSTWLD